MSFLASCASDLLAPALNVLALEVKATATNAGFGGSVIVISVADEEIEENMVSPERVAVTTQVPGDFAWSASPESSQPVAVPSVTA
jgi:hypothetical protein